MDYATQSCKDMSLINELSWTFTRYGDKVIADVTTRNTQIHKKTKPYDYEMRFLKDLKTLGEYSHLYLRISSPGGALASAFGMAYALLTVKDMSAIIHSCCNSAASILICLLKCPVYITPDATILIHMPKKEVHKKRNGAWTCKTGEASPETVKLMASIYRSRTKRRKFLIMNWMNRSYRINARDAVRHNFCDGIKTLEEFEKEW